MDLNEIISPYLKEDTDVDTILKNVNGFVEKQNQEFTANLSQNRDAILSEKKELKTKYDELNKKYTWLEQMENPLTQESYSDMMSEMDTLKSSVTRTADEFSQKLDEKYQAGKDVANQTWEGKYNQLLAEKKESDSRGDAYKSRFENFQVENKLRSELSKLGVQSDEFWFNGLKQSAESTFGESGLEEITLPFNGNRLPLADWGRSFVNSDLGKKMIPAGFNSGMEGVGSGPGREGGVPSAEEIAKIPDQAKRLAMYEKYGYTK